MSKPESIGDVLRKKSSRRSRPSPWRRGVRVTDLDGTASQIRTALQEASGESVTEDPPTVTRGVER